jgi:exopolysaccharide production protein ExoZ
MKHSPRIYYFGIDVIRLTAALTVAFYHLTFSSWASPTSNVRKLLRGAYETPGWAPFTWFGWVGVEIFFVISGFVIANSAQKATAWQYVRNRSLRLYPANLICTAITGIAIYLSGTGLPKSAFVATMLLIPTGPWLSGQYWTLGIEITFYAMVWVLLVFHRNDWIKHLALFLAIFSLICLILIELRPNLLWLGFGKPRLFLTTYGGCFALGIAIRDWAVGRGNKETFATGVIGLIGAIVEIRFHAHNSADLAKNAPFDLHPLWPVPVTIFLLAVLAMLASIRWAERVAAWPKPVTGLMRAAGLTTYPLYLIHFAIGVLMARAFVLAGWSPSAAVIVSIAFLTVAAWTIANYVEPHLKRTLAFLLDQAASRVAGHRLRPHHATDPHS